MSRQICPPTKCKSLCATGINCPTAPGLDEHAADGRITESLLSALKGTTRAAQVAWAIGLALRGAEFRNTELKADLRERGVREVTVTFEAVAVTAVL